MNNKKADTFRIEKDYLGEMKVPAAAYYGVQTARAIENFSVSGQTSQPVFTMAMVSIKKAAAMVNVELGCLDGKIGRVIILACDRILNGEFHDQFLVDVYQAGAGTSHHMNVNEVIANVAIEMLGGTKGDYSRARFVQAGGVASGKSEVYGIEGEYVGVCPQVTGAGVVIPRGPKAPEGNDGAVANRECRKESG
jgi:aspartate ammonia-lyase